MRYVKNLRKGDCKMSSIRKVMSSALKNTRAITFAALAAAATVASPSNGVAAEPKAGGTLVVALQGASPILVSAFNSGGFIGVVSTKMMEGLVKYDFELNPQPLLAESWDISSDGKTVRFNLRKDVKWHDGEDFTAEDVKFSLMNIWKELHPRGRSTFAKVTSVDTPDEHTVVINLSEPTPFLMKALGSYESQIVPEHIYAGTDILTNPNNNAPIGTGPFMFEEWEKGNYLRLVKNPNYWREGRPYLDGIVLRNVPDAGTRSAGLEAGDIHLATFSPVPLSDVERLSEVGNVGVETRGYELLSPMFLLDLNKRGPYLSDVNVRRAMAHAINLEFITDKIWFGYGKPATGPIPSTHKHVYTDEVPSYPYDPAKANELLDEAGFLRKDDGMRFDLSIDFGVFGDEYPRTAEYLKQAFKAVGIDLTLRSQDVGNLFKRVFTDYDYDIHMNYWYAGADPTIGVQRLYWCDNIRKGVPFTNSNGYCTEEMDRILEATQVENDPEKRKELFAEMQVLAQTDLPVLDLFEVKFLTVYNTNVHDHTIGADGPYGSYADVWMEK